MAGFVLVATPMIARLLSWAMVAVAVASAAACGGIAAGEPSPSKKQDPGLSSGGAPSGGSESSTPPPLKQRLPANFPCCPFDMVRSGTMHLGGAKLGGECVETSDFWCSTNWRVEQDASYCAKWVYDVRKPAPDEDAHCQSADTCTPGAYVFCRCADASEGTKLCKDDGHSFEPCSPCP